MRLADEHRIEDVPWLHRALQHLRDLLGRRALEAARGLHDARANDDMRAER